MAGTKAAARPADDAPTTPQVAADGVAAEDVVPGHAGNEGIPTVAEGAAEAGPTGGTDVPDDSDEDDDDEDEEVES